MPKAHASKRFMGWRDVVLTPIVEVGLLTLAYLATSFLPTSNLVEWAVLYYASVNIVTIVALGVLRLVSPLRPGSYSLRDNAATCYTWNLYGFLCCTNLSLLLINNLLPIPFRKVLYELLGAKIGAGMSTIAGRIMDPHLVRLGKNVIIGDDALLLPHAIAGLEDDVLLLGRIAIGDNVIVGARTVIQAGTTIGENSMVTMMSLVERNTSIPANEIWGGIPARKIKDRVPSQNLS